MTTVTITLTDIDDDTVQGNMVVEGMGGSEEIEFTDAVIFGETIMRALPNEGMRHLAMALVPEAFDESGEV